MPETGLDALLACPRCDATLTAHAERHHCAACKVDYPDIGGLPFLFAEPGAALGEWRARVNLELQTLARQTGGLDRELAQDDLLPATRQRLTHLRDACADQKEKLALLLEPLLQGSPAAARETYLALRTRLPSDQGLNTYYNNLHRDWAWSSDENRITQDLVADYLPTEPGDALVLGAGAGRLSYDLHQTTSTQRVVALDFNPLLLTAASRLAAGNEVSLWEFPLAPRGGEDNAVLRVMRAAPARPGVHFVIADALRPPLAAGSFDVVVTPWLIDILPVDLQEFSARVNNLLKPGGRWINFGSLTFPHPEHATRFSVGECADVIASNGFGDFDSREDEIPYMCSPASRHGRREIVVTWRADKTAECEQPPRHSALPEWLVTGKEPVPTMREFELQAASTRIHAFVMGLINGKRSIRDMARLMQNQRLMQAEEAEGVIRGFLIKMYEDSRRA